MRRTVRQALPLKSPEKPSRLCFPLLPDMWVHFNYWKGAAAKRSVTTSLLAKMACLCTEQMLFLVSWTQNKYLSNGKRSGHLSVGSEEHSEKNKTGRRQSALNHQASGERCFPKGLNLFSAKSGSSWAKCYSGHESRGSSFAEHLIQHPVECPTSRLMTEWANEWINEWMNQSVRTSAVLAKSRFLYIQWHRTKLGHWALLHGFHRVLIKRGSPTPKCIKNLKNV